MAKLKISEQVHKDKEVLVKKLYKSYISKSGMLDPSSSCAQTHATSNNCTPTRNNLDSSFSNAQVSSEPSSSKNFMRSSSAYKEDYAYNNISQNKERPASRSPDLASIRNKAESYLVYNNINIMLTITSLN